MVNHDRFGLFRPTANEKGEVVHAGWSTIRNVHLDVSYFRYSYYSSQIYTHFTLNTVTIVR